MTSTFDEGPDENTVSALLLGLLSVVEKPSGGVRNHNTVDSKSELLIVAITVLKILISFQLITLIADELE